MRTDIPGGRTAVAAAVLIAGLGMACGPQEEDWPGRKRARELAGEKLPTPFEDLKPLYKLMGKPQPGDWLARHQEEGQSFADYKSYDPIRPNRRHKTIYIQPMGEFTADQEKIIRLAAEYMRLYFTVPVETKPLIPLTDVPAESRRERFGTTQILTSWVRESVLKPRRPDDALAFLAFTSNDLWPGPGWNFVFGEASLNDRVGVWSIHRNGNPSESEAAFRLCLLRTIKTATHEAGHILTMYHCLAYDCNMNGSNHRAESDSRPLALCPACLAKLCWNTGCNPARRYEDLLRFCEREKLKDEAAFFLRALQAVRAAGK